MKTPLLEHYDWIILGDHPASLWVALILLEEGLKVLVVPKLAESVEPGFHVRESNWCPAWVDEAFFENENVKKTQQAIQVLTPEKRFKILQNDDDFLKEWKSVFGETLTVADFENPRLRDLVHGLGFVYRGHDFSKTFSDDWSKILKGVLKQRFVEGGKKTVKQALKQKIEKKGGRILTDHYCQQIFVEEKGFQGVQLQGISKMISASSAILSVNWDWSQAYFSTQHSLKSDPLGWWFTFQFTIPAEIVPVGATSKMIYAEAGAPVIEIEKVSTKSWIARTLLPYQTLSLNREFQRKTAQRIFKVLETVFPFIEYSATDLVPDLRDPEKVEEFDLPQLYPFRNLNHIPPPLLAYGGKGMGHQSPYANLYLAYEESYPRYGEWGVYHAAATSILDWTKKNIKTLNPVLVENLRSKLKVAVIDS